MTNEQLDALRDIKDFESSLFAVAVEFQAVVLAVRQHQDSFGKRTRFKLVPPISDKEQGPISKQLLDVVRDHARTYASIKVGYSSVVSRHYRALKAFNQLISRRNHIFKDTPDSNLSPQERLVKEKASRMFKTIQLGEHLYD